MSMQELTEIRLKAHKKFLDMSNWKDVVKRATDAETNEEERDELREVINLEIQDHITRSISLAIPRALYLKMKLDPTVLPEIYIGPFTYGIGVRDNGSGVTISPSFNSIDNTGERWKVDLFDEKPHKNSDLAHIIAKYIDDQILINSVLNFLMSWEYDTVKNDWVKNEPRFKDLVFTSEDAKFMIAIHVLTILYYLTNGDKDDDGFVELVVPLEGVYRLNPTHEGFLDVGFIPSLEYKLAVKNDPLSAQIEKNETDYAYIVGTV